MRNKIKILFVLLLAFSFNSFADNNEVTYLSKFLCSSQENKNCHTKKYCLNAVKNHLYTCMEKAVKNKVDTENMTAYYRYLEACSLKEQSKVSNVKNSANENCS